MREFWVIYWEICEKHQKWYDELTDKCNIYSKSINDYNDPQIRDACDDKTYQEGQNINGDWKNLREEIEKYLESRNLPLRYEERYWTAPTIGTESYTRNGKGDVVRKGFDPPIGRWCSTTLNGMTYVIYERRRIQRIESYTKWGLIIGFAGFIISLISICISVV